MKRGTALKAAILGMTLTAAATIAQAQTPALAPSFDFKVLEGRPILNQTPVGVSGQWTLEKLLSLSQKEMETLWRQLPAPTLQEMNGSYMGIGPQADRPDVQPGYAAYMYDVHSSRGAWQGKAFRPLTATTGEGYNRWRFPGGRIERNLRMATRIDNSILDGKPAYILDYPAMNKTTLFDEVRKLEEGIYIGAATVAQKDGPNGNGTRGRIDTFVLIGPTDEWVGAPYGEHQASWPAGKGPAAAKK